MRSSAAQKAADPQLGRVALAGSRVKPRNPEDRCNRSRGWRGYLNELRSVATRGAKPERHGQKIKMKKWDNQGWLVGIEPTTSRTTI